MVPKFTLLSKKYIRVKVLFGHIKLLKLLLKNLLHLPQAPLKLSIAFRHTTNKMKPQNQKSVTDYHLKNGQNSVLRTSQLKIDNI